jgi:hypothetical protein
MLFYYFIVLSNSYLFSWGHAYQIMYRLFEMPVLTDDFKPSGGRDNMLLGSFSAKIYHLYVITVDINLSFVQQA